MTATGDVVRNNQGAMHAIVRGDQMDPKLTILFMLIDTIISLSHLDDENLAKIKHGWRNAISALLLMNERNT